MPGPDVTVVVVPRESFRHTAASLESIVAHTRMPYELVYVDGHAPGTDVAYFALRWSKDWIDDSFAHFAAEWRVPVDDPGLASNRAWLEGYRWRQRPPPARCAPPHGRHAGGGRDRTVARRAGVGHSRATRSTGRHAP